MLNVPTLRVYCLSSFHPQNRYSTALYFVFTALCSVGFGNVAPITDNEMIFAIVMMLLGCKCVVVGGGRKGAKRLE